MRPRIISMKYPERRYPMCSGEVLEVLGVRGGKLPLLGMEPRMIQGIRVWVEPHVPRADGRKTSRHRVLCACPECGVTVSVGRLSQHRCPRPSLPLPSSAVLDDQGTFQ